MNKEPRKGVMVDDQNYLKLAFSPLCLAFSGQISADSDAKLHDMYEPVRRK
jgi:hypothetical protein